MGKQTQSGYLTSAIGRGALMLALLASVSACGGGKGAFWQGQEIHVEARQSELETTVGRVSGEYRELRDRFDALERLYIDLARNARAQGEALQNAVANYEQVVRDPELVKAIAASEAALVDLTAKLQKMEDRLFKVEMADSGGNNFANRTPQRTAQPRPSGRDDTTSAANLSLPTVTPLAADPGDVAPLFGIHLEAIRSADDAQRSWQEYRQTYGAEISGLTPLLFRYVRGTLDVFRLIAGPFTTRAEAQQACDTLKGVDPEQFCAVVDYQGDPLP